MTDTVTKPDGDAGGNGTSADNGKGEVSPADCLVYTNTYRELRDPRVVPSGVSFGEKDIERIGEIVRVLREPDGDGDVKILLPDTHSMWWPAAALGPAVSTPGTVVDIGAVDVSDYTQLRKAMMAMMERLRFCGPGAIRMVIGIMDFEAERHDVLAAGMDLAVLMPILNEAVQRRSEPQRRTEVGVLPIPGVLNDLMNSFTGGGGKPPTKH